MKLKNASKNICIFFVFVSAAVLADQRSDLIVALDLASRLKVATTNEVGSWRKFADVVDSPAQALQSKSIGEEIKAAGASQEFGLLLKTPVYVLTSLNQGICSGGAWSCGFHSLKNVLYVLEALTQLSRVSQAQYGQIFIKMKENLVNKSYFEKIFLNGGTVENPALQSWLSFAQTLKDFKQQDGIFPADQRLLLEKLSQKQVVVPDNISDIQSFVNRLYPINGLNQDFVSSDDFRVIVEAMYRLKNNQVASVAFTMPQTTASKHFIGVVFYKTQQGLELFVVDSLNKILDQDANMIEELLRWYLSFDDKVSNCINNDLKKKLDSYSDSIQKDPSRLLTVGFIDTLRQMFFAIQDIILAEKTTKKSFGELKEILRGLVGFYKEHKSVLGEDRDVFMFSDSGGNSVNVYQATEGILPKTYGEFNSMLDYWLSFLR